MSGNQGYEQPGGYIHMPPPNPNSTMAITSLVLGILSYVCLGFLAAIPAIICGHSALAQIRRGEVSDSNRGLALAGLILGYVNLIITVLAIIAYAIFVLIFLGAATAGATL